jgi:hypothetical protein
VIEFLSSSEFSVVIDYSRVNLPKLISADFERTLNYIEY